MIDFRDTPQAARICCQFSVSLIAVETFPHLAVDQESIPDERTVQSTMQETCLGTDAISFNVNVPDLITPSFATGFCKILTII
jgi:hypothetical protein